MKRLVVLTGAGMSAESGFATFRDSGGLWENYDVMEVASPEGWVRDKGLVNQFYNERRVQLRDSVPNGGHLALAQLEERFEVHIVTQNVDDLHERAGSSRVLHLHGELTKVESCSNSALVYDIGYRQVGLEERAEDGGQLRPHIVWFGEAVPAIEEAVNICLTADIFVIIGTSLAVYPAASLTEYVKAGAPIYLVDPHKPKINHDLDYHFINKRATAGIQELISLLV
ncbi:SIR2 family NAD-dependent protein deacylase [Desulfotalea psychrophila]|uniref:protein acetyllysine N-acetyltransferase n=1 Tax=Desulfotalea psychrophila (strain LSv54 / DSM 12343) TaxID=177439 RepID=Q6AIJ8_DESPS|nr:Sir2 family NAD-dependent protein deacetylase [Desulfotalea psychrophila]CAG37832.1 conserved hypothetical protein [Desulfotalea psychrophila LSv54]